jgi:hypothetical protein
VQTAARGLSLGDRSKVRLCSNFSINSNLSKIYEAPELELTNRDVLLKIIFVVAVEFESQKNCKVRLEPLITSANIWIFTIESVK